MYNVNVPVMSGHLLNMDSGHIFWFPFPTKGDNLISRYLFGLFTNVIEYEYSYSKIIADYYCSFDVHFWNFSILYPAFPVKDNEAVRYATCTRLNHGYIGTWVKDVAVQTYYACM